MQEIEIAREIERLFYLQDRPITQDKKDMLVSELASTGYPFRAVIAGIRSLVEQDLKSIKFCTIKEASRKNFEYQDNHDDCEICGKEGFVSMVNSTGYSVLYPCICDRGREKVEAQGLVGWNGKKNMVSKTYGLVYFTHRDIEKLNIKEMSEQEYADAANITPDKNGNWQD